MLHHVLGVVGGVIDADGRPHLVEVGDKHSLLVEVGDAQRPLYGVHAFALAPILYGFQQGERDVRVVDELYPAETYATALPYLVGLMVDDAHDAAHRFSLLAVCHEGKDLAVLQSGVVLRVEPSAHVSLHVRYIAWIALVNLPREPYEVVHLALCLGNLYGALHAYLKRYSFSLTLYTFYIRARTQCAVIGCKDTKKYPKTHYSRY